MNINSMHGKARLATRSKKPFLAGKTYSLQATVVINFATAIPVSDPLILHEVDFTATGPFKLTESPKPRRGRKLTALEQRRVLREK